MTDISPCEFCRSTDVFTTAADPLADDYDVCVACGGCGARGPEAKTGDDAIAGWNRAAGAAPVAVQEARTEWERGTDKRIIAAAIRGPRT